MGGTKRRGSNLERGAGSPEEMASRTCTDVGDKVAPRTRGKVMLVGNCGNTGTDFPSEIELNGAKRF